MGKLLPNVSSYIDDRAGLLPSKSSKTVSWCSDKFREQYDSTHDADRKLKILKDVLRCILRKILTLDDSDVLQDSVDLQSLGLDSVKFEDIKNSLQAILGERAAVHMETLTECSTLHHIAEQLHRAIEEDKIDVDNIPTMKEEEAPCSKILNSDDTTVNKNDKFSFARRLVLNFKNASLFSLIFLTLTVIIPTCAAVSGAVWLVALIFSYSDPSLGRFATYQDLWLDENFTDYAPKGTIISAITLDGQMSLTKLKSLFMDNVLNKKLSHEPSKLHYPELKQYLTNFCGFRIWKLDPHFSIDNHIFQGNDKDGSNIEKRMEELINKPFKRKRSPWEIVLFNLKPQKSDNVTILVLRTHHVLMDGKSILKMMIDCLGQKPLKTSQVSNHNFQICTSHSHPWRNTNFGNDKYSKLLLSFSKCMKVGDLKHVAKKFKVSGSSVVLSIIAGAVRNFGIDLSSRDIIIGYPLPKPNHPETLANHMYYGVFSLPTNEGSIIKRLEKCNKLVINAKNTELGICTNIVRMICGSVIFPFSRILPVNYYVPMIVTNIAGEGEGFEIGGVPCSDFRMISGPRTGAASILVSIFSYRNTFTVGISAKEYMLSKHEINNLATYVENELNVLLKM